MHSEVIGVAEIADNTTVPFIVVRQRGEDYREKLVLKAGEGVRFKVRKVDFFCVGNNVHEILEIPLKFY